MEYKKVGEVFMKKDIYGVVLVDTAIFKFFPSDLKGKLDWTDLNLVTDTARCFIIDLKRSDVHLSDDGSDLVFDAFTCDSIVDRSIEIRKYIIDRKYEELGGDVLTEKHWKDIDSLNEVNSEPYSLIPYNYDLKVENKTYKVYDLLSIYGEWQETLLSSKDIFNIMYGKKNYNIRILDIECAFTRNRIFKRTDNLDKAKEISLYIKDVDELRQLLLSAAGNCPVKKLFANGLCNNIKLK